MTAFSAESQARNRYCLFAEKAEKDGFLPVAEAFREIAKNEKAHSEIWLSYLGTIGTTEQNLSSSASGEYYEWSEMYHSFAETARDEGLDDIAVKMEEIAKIEAEHEKRFLSLYEIITSNRISHCDNTMVWRCANCGHIHIGEFAPERCPICGRERSIFEQKPKNT